MNHSDNNQNHEDVGRVVAHWLDGKASSQLAFEAMQASENIDEINSAFDQILVDSLLKQSSQSDGAEQFVDLVTDVDGDFSEPKSKSNSKTGIKLRDFGWVVSIASLILLSIVLVREFGRPVSAAPVDVLQTALQIHQQPLERIYAVEFQRGDEKNSLQNGSNRSIQVITQGDQFWVSVHQDNQKWAWGREENGDVWVALAPEDALRIDRKEVGDSVQSFSNLYSLNLKTLLEQVMKECELKMTQDNLTHIIEATGTDSSRRYLNAIDAVIEIDRETKAVRRLQITRHNLRRSRTVTFSLIETRAVQPEMYSPEGHIGKGVTILEGPKTLEKRRELLRQRFGSYTENWILEP